MRIPNLITFETPWGWFGLLLDGRRVLRLTVAHRSASAATTAIRPWLGEGVPSPAEDNSIVTRLQAYALGQFDDFRDVAVDTSYLTPLGQKVFEQCRRIKYGKTKTYGQIAAAAGHPGAARAVGNFMASNRTPILVPCHRVVASGGQLGGFTAIGGTSLKKKLLAIESATRPLSTAAPDGRSPNPPKRSENRPPPD